MHRPGVWRLGALAIPTMLFLQSVHVFLPSIYAMSIDTLSLGGSTAYAIVFLLSFVVLAVPPRKAPSAALLVGSFSVTARLGLVVQTGLDMRLPLAALAVGSYLLYLPLHLLSRGNGTPPAVDVAGFVLGLCGDATVRAVFFGADPFSSSWGSVSSLIAFALGILCVAYAHRPDRRLAAPAISRVGPPGALRVALAGLSFGAIFSLEITLLGYPQVLARFATVSEPAATVAILAGLGGGLALVLRGLSPSPPWLLLGNVVFVAAVADVAWFGSPALPFLVAIAQLTVVMDLAALLPYILRDGPSSRSVGLAFGVGGVVFLLYLFAFVFALAYAFVPGRALWEGRLPSYLLITALVAGASSSAIGWRSRIHPPPVQPVGKNARMAATWASVALLLVAGVGSAVVPTPTEPSGASSIVVMTYNIHQGFGSDGLLRVERVEALIRSADADIVALQESDTARITSGNQDTIRFLAARLGYYEAYGPPTRDQVFGVSILSRFPILQWKTIPLPSLEAQRVIVEAEMLIGSRAVRVYATHFGLPQEERALQIDFVKATIAPALAPTIFLGDFNSPPSENPPDNTFLGDVYAHLIGDWQDSWTAAGHALKDSAGNTWPSTSPFTRIDYVFLSPGIVVESSEVPRGFLSTPTSDHLPVIARIRLP